MSRLRSDPPYRVHTLFLSVAAVALACLAGCNPSEEALLPVEGQVKFNGTPLSKGALIFHPDAGKGNASKHQPHASIDAQGRYKVFTHPREGAPAGWYKITVRVTEPSDPKNPYSVPRSAIPEKFANPDESGLALEVRAGAAPGDYDLELK